MAEPIRVVIVDDHALVRSGVRAQLTDADGFEVVGEAEDVDTAIRTISRTRPDVVLLDVHLPGGNGPAVISGCAEAAPATGTFKTSRIASPVYDQTHPGGGHLHLHG